MTDGMERFRTLLMMLLDTISAADEDLAPSALRLRQLASAAGFNENEAEDIAIWLENLSGSPFRAHEATSFTDGDLGEGVRVFADSERDYLTSETFGFLMALDRTGQISPRQRENILHFLSHAAVEPLGLEDVDEIVDQVLLQRIEEQGHVMPPTEGGLCH